MLGVGRKWLNWEGGRTDAAVELGGWAHGRGGWTGRVGARTRWLNWEGGRTDAVVELGGWAHGRGGWAGRVGVRTRAVARTSVAESTTQLTIRILKRWWSCCNYLKHIFVRFILFFIFFYINFYFQLHTARRPKRSTVHQNAALCKYDALWCIYDAYKSYLFIMVYGQIFVDGTWGELTVNNKCKANCLFLNQLYFSKFLNLELKSRSGCLVRNKSWSIGEPDARPKARNILYTLSHFGISFNLWH